MAGTDRTPFHSWTRSQAMILSVLCLLAGIAGGWFIRGFQAPAAAGPEKVATLQTQAGPPSPASPAPTPAQLKEMADAQAAPLLDKLRPDPKNPDLLTSIGNIYYDAHQYPIAVDYYGRALQFRPADASVRTDMGTAYWFMGDADRALAEFNKALGDAPKNPNTLFNRGLVRWQGKKDSAGAISDWEKLLVADPNYPDKAKVEEMLADVKKHQVDTPASMEK